MSLVVRNVEVDGSVLDVSIDGDRIVAVGPSAAIPHGAETVDGDGGVLLPGLWDHHIHVVALAAARRSVRVGPPEVRDADALAQVLRTAAAAGGWVRAVGYHESVAGPLDREVLEQLVPGTPVRVQHRSGAMWALNGTALDAFGLGGENHPGLERDGTGRPTGRLFGGDRWLRDRLEAADPAPPPDLSAVGRELASYGITGVTDATPYERLDDLDFLAAATANRDIPQRVVAMSGPALTDRPPPVPLERGPVKLLLADHSLPALDELAAWIGDAHRHGRPTASHCVTRASLVLALTALDIAGVVPGDRIEHAAVVPPEMRDRLLTTGLTVVTQPNFVAERGDEYLADVDADDRPHLYPCASLLGAGVPVGGSTDAPFGHPDPWRAVAAAIERRTGEGTVLGAHERVPAAAALRLFLTAPEQPGGATRRIAPGERADLCLLDRTLGDALWEPSADHVRMTVIAGQVAHRR